MFNVILVCTKMAFSHIRVDVSRNQSSKQEDRDLTVNLLAPNVGKHLEIHTLLQGDRFIGMAENTSCANISDYTSHGQIFSHT